MLTTQARSNTQTTHIPLQFITKSPNTNNRMPGEGWLRGRDIGRGSTATVFLANSIATGDTFAIKSTEFSRSALLQREYTILSSLSSPTIISCLGFNIAPRDGGALYYNLFLEFAPGGSLADHIKSTHDRVPDESEIGSKTRDILEGLSYLHGRGIVHCDVKPANVLLGSDGRAKIGDLGCARRIGSREREVVRGTPMYMSPEAVRGEEQGMPADIWSLGCVVIEMITGKPPWPEIGDLTASIRRIGYSSDVPEIPGWVTAEGRDFIGKCLRRNAEERWTAEELRRHPFVNGSDCGELSWVSPKSILELRLWELMEEEEEEVERGEGFSGIIKELAGVSGNGNWNWDEEWFEVRNGEGQFGEEGEFSGGGGGEVGMVAWSENSEVGEGDECKMLEWSVGWIGRRVFGLIHNWCGWHCLSFGDLLLSYFFSILPLLEFVVHVFYAW